MKARLSSTIWLLVFWIGAALFGVLGLAYYAGSHSAAGADATSFPGGANGALVVAATLALAASISLVYVLGKRVLTPVQEIATFSERLVAGDVRARVEIGTSDEFGFIAENFNRSAAKVAHAVTNQQAQDSLQRSITDLLNTISQVARGDLNIRGKVSNDALGNVVDSVNFMLDNFTKVLERVRKAAVDVSTSANQILEAADDMTTRKPARKPLVGRWMPRNKATARCAIRWMVCSGFALRCKRPPRKSNRWVIAHSKFRKSST
jgi:methyl-accepting chemotaxis protein